MLTEARWQLAGSTVDVAGNANIVVGVIAVTHGEATWIVEEQVNELRSRYEVTPLEAGATAAPFTGVSGLFGPMRGSYVFFDDIILLAYRSDDGRYTGLESMRRVAPERYESRGTLLLDGAHVSSWSLTMSS